MSQESKSIFELSPQRRALLEAMLQAEGLAPAPDQTSLQEGSQSRENGSRIERVVWDGPLPLSYAQQRLWFMQSLAPESTSWHMPIVVRLSGPLDIPALVRAVHDIMVHQDTLRTTVIEKNGEASQVVLPNNDLCVVDLESVPEDAQTFIQQVIETRFKFGKEPFARAVIFRLSPLEHVLVFVLHHIIADGWSVAALQNSLAQAYNNALRRHDTGLRPLPVQFSDFVWWERQRLSSPSWASQLDYWECKLHDTPILRLPFRSSNTLGSIKQERCTCVFTERLNKLLYDFCHQQRVTPFSVLLAALQTALARLSGQTDFGIGVPVTNRSQLQLETLIAPLLNTVVLRTPLDLSASAKAMVARVNENLVEAMDHGEIPFQQVIERLRPNRNLEQSPIFQVMASMGSTPALKSELVPGLVTEFVRADKPWLEVDLILALAETPHGLSGSFEFDAAKFDSESLHSFADLFLHLLEQMVSEPEIALRDLHLLSVEQRRLLTTLTETEFNGIEDADSLIAALCDGSAVVLSPGEKNPVEKTFRSCHEQNITVLSITITFWKEIVAHLDEPGLALPASVRLVITTGERLPLHRLQRWQEHVGRDVQLINVHGGVAIDVTSVAAKDFERERSSVVYATAGILLSRYRAYVRDRCLDLVPTGLIGELYIGDMYRTGELACRLANGSYEVVTRIENRVQTEEVRAALQRHTEVKDAVVLPQAEGNSVAFVVCDSGRRITYRDFVQHLHNHLPDYMMPARIMYLKEFPTTANGEIDRQALASIAARESASTVCGEQTPETPVEAILSLLWEEVLEQSEIGRDDNFFDLGGQSLSALRLALRIQEAFRIEVVPQVLFDSPTLRGMARKIEEAASIAVDSSSNVLPVQFEGPPPLSFGQERLWFLDQVGGGAQYNIPASLRLRGELDVEALERSLQLVVKRHGALRSAFRSNGEGGATVQVVAEAEFKLTQVDLSGLSLAEGDSRARELMKEEAQRPFELSQPPLVRGLLIRLQESEYYLVVTLHHIAGDAWSAGVLVHELAAAYTAYCDGREPELAQLETDYGDFARWQRERVQGEFLREQLQYWRQQLAGVEALRLPVMGGQRGVESGAGGQVKRVLSAELSDRVRQLGRAETATSFMVLLACWQLLLGRLSGQSDVTVATPFSNRPRREWEGVVGFFVNTLVLRARLHLGDSFRELVRQVRQTCLAAYAHQELPFERLVEELGRQRLFQAMFVMQNVAMAAVSLAGLESEGLEVETGTAKVELNLQAFEGKEETALLLEYSREVLDEAGAEDLLRRYEALLQLVCESPDSRLELLPWIDAIQTHERSAHSSYSVEGSERSIGAMVQRVVAQHGPRLAIQTETENVTYIELSERADRIGRALVERCGTGPGQVALLCPRGAAMLASILGALLANKTYVAIDPTWPSKRIKTILADAEAGAILFEREFREQAASFETAIRIDVEEVLAGPPVTPLADEGDPDQLAYILYTSGSTGVPKGVMQSHRNVLTHIENYANSLRLDFNDRLSLFPAYCYDAAVMDIFGALFTGAALYPFDASTTEPTELVARIEEAQITILHLTPTVFRHLLQGANGAAAFASVRAVVLGGEEAGPDIFPLFQEHFAPDCILINGLGPTECTVALQYSCTASSRMSGKLPVGRPVNGMRAQLVDENNRSGALEGEIILSGEQLALGYWRRPEITAERFSADKEGRRSYRTGDLGRLLSDGNIEYIGRKDFQVKIQGVRIELYEIEAALLKVSAVQSAVVVLSERGEIKQLLAYYTSTHKLDEDEIRNELAASLPLAMVPARFVEVQEMPLLSNGKIDRQALLNSDESSATHSFKLPKTWLERALVEIWQQVLRTQPISIDDNFFALGGHSLLALRLLSTVFRNLGCRLPIAALFETPTIESMALRIAVAQGHEQHSALVRMQPEGPRPPLFLVHPAGGDVLCFRHLTLALGNEQPAYGLQDPALASGNTPLTSIPEIASNYLRAIEAVRLQGQWALGGWSFGGVVAFEMCRQLRADGEALPELILFDTWAPGLVTQSLPLDDAGLLAFIARWDFNIEVDVKDIESKTLEEQIAFVADLTAGSARAREHISSELFRARDILHARRTALISYKPDSYDGPITLFRAADRPLQPEPDFIDYPDNGWSQLCTGSLEVVSVSGNHTTMAEPPNVETLAREVSVRLDAAFSVHKQYT